MDQRVGSSSLDWRSVGSPGESDFRIRENRTVKSLRRTAESFDIAIEQSGRGRSRKNLGGTAKNKIKCWVLGAKEGNFRITVKCATLLQK